MKQGKNCKIYHPEKSVLLDCTIGDDCTIHAPVWIGNNVKIGSRCKIQAFAFIPDGVTISDDVFIGPHVCFTNDKHPPSNVRSTTFVGRGVSIGANATIVCGVTLGERSKVAAGAIVTKNLPKNSMGIGRAADRRYANGMWIPPDD